MTGPLRDQFQKITDAKTGNDYEIIRAGRMYQPCEFRHRVTGQLFTILCDEKGVFTINRDEVQELIRELQEGLDALSDSTLLALSKESLLESYPDMFPQIYGEDDPLWQEYLTLYSSKSATHSLWRKHRNVAGFVYIVRGESYYKIGYSEDPAKRIAVMNTKAPFPLYTIFLIPTEDKYACEKALHARFANRRTQGEWFALTPDDLAEIRMLYPHAELAQEAQGGNS